MKKIRMFKAAWCPHCKNASNWLEELFEDNEKVFEGAPTKEIVKKVLDDAL